MPLREEFQSQGNWLFRWRSYLPLAIVPLLLLALNDAGYARSRADFIYQGLCLLISFTGLAIRCVAIGYAARGTSGRNTAGQMAATVNTAGLYAVVRHPLYLGNFTIFLGMVLSIGVWWFALVFALLFWVYYERIMYAEEEFLRGKFGQAYTDWANATPAFIPRLG
jgi:protein-S-isoprenylcysteine O-methyltransferase Ste14